MGNTANVLFEETTEQAMAENQPCATGAVIEVMVAGGRFTGTGSGLYLKGRQRCG